MDRTYSSAKVKKIPNHFTHAESIIIQCYHKGAEYKNIVNILNNLGYVNVRKKPVTQGDVSSFLLSKGLRRFKPQKKRIGQLELKPVPAPPIAATVKVETKKLQSQNSLLKDAEDLLTSNLSDELKSRFLRNLIA